MPRHRMAALVGLLVTSQAACLADTSREGGQTGLGPSADGSDTSPETSAPAIHDVPFQIRTLGASPTARVCYDAEVRQGERVTWARGDLTTTAGGAAQSGPLESRVPTRAPDGEALCAEGGGISWTASCDPAHDADPARPGVQAELRVVFDEVDTYDPRELIAPCLEGCTVAFDCEPRDEPLTLDLALVLNAGRGFSNPTSAVGGLWCEAQRTSCYPFLEDETGERQETTIVGFVCAAGSADVQLALGPVTVACDGHRFELEPIVAGDGLAEDGERRLRFATFFGREDLPWSDDEVLVKRYYNLGIETARLNELGSCRLEWSATAHLLADGLFRGSQPTADALVYPFYTLDVALTRDGEPVCDANLEEGRDHLRPTLFGNVPGYEPLPARCFELSGESPAPTGHPGCE